MSRLTSILDAILVAGAITRINRTITNEDLGEWIIKNPAYNWAEFNSDYEPVTKKQKLVSGLDCPFCVGTWTHVAGQSVNAIVPKSGLARKFVRTISAGLFMSWISAHVSTRLDNWLSELNAGFDKIED